MIRFAYTINDELGIHARPAGQLVKKATVFESEITLGHKGKTCSAKKLFAVMGLGVKKGDTISISVEGADEELASAEIKKFIEENL